MREFTRPVFSSLPLAFRVLIHEQSSRSVIGIPRNPIGQAWQTLQRHQIRCAHNLGNRYKTLETKIRPPEIQRQVVAGEIYNTNPPNQSVGQEAVDATLEGAPEMEELSRGGSKSILRPKPRLFKGVRIPIRPPPPASDECCMSSCTVCVYDLYATALEDYDEDLVQARKELSAKKVPSQEWPLDVLTEADRTKRLEERKHEGGVEAGRRVGVTGETEHDRQMAVIIGAFVKFEQSLREKRRAEQLHTQGQIIEDVPVPPVA